MYTPIQSLPWLSLLSCVLCLSSPAHGQDQPPAKPPFPAPRVWKEYPSQVNSASVSPDGKLVAVVNYVGGKTSTFWVLVYDRATGMEKYRFPAHDRAPGGCVGFTPDGKRIVSSTATSEDGRTEKLHARIGDAATGKEIRSIPLRPGQYLYSQKLYAVSDKVLVIAGKNQAATVYDLATGKPLGDLPGVQRLEKIALSRDGRWLVGISNSSDLHAWDVEKRAYSGKIRDFGGLGTIRAVAISPDGSSVALFYGGHRRIYVVDRVSREDKAKCEYVFHAEHLYFTADGKTIVGAGVGPNYSLVFWDWQTSKEMRGGSPKGAKEFYYMRGPRGEAGRKAWRWGDMSDFGMSDDGKTIAFGEYGGKLSLLELTSPEPPPKK